MGAAPAATAEKAEASASAFFPIPMDCLDESTLAMDLFIKHGSSRTPTLYRNKGLEFTKDDLGRLREQRVEYVYIPMEQHRVYRQYLASRLEKTFRDPGKQKQERARVIRAASTKMIEDVFAFPGAAGPVEAVAEISKQFAAWSEDDPQGFSYLLDMSSHDYYTTTHMVNVGAGCGLLVRELRPRDNAMIALAVQGGMLHDIGKRGVPDEVLNKEDKLTPEEWEQIRRHPLAGYDELKENPALPAQMLEMVRDHHERLDGGGYPAGLAGDQIGFLARVCAVVDVFDAITAARSYRGPIPPQNALDLMRKDVGAQFDRDVFDAWGALIERFIADDPKRALPRAAEEPGVSLDELQPTGPGAGAGDESEYSPENRRVHRRFPARLPISAYFVHQGKHCGVKVGERFSAVTTDLSRGGMRVLTPWPMSVNDVLVTEMAGKDGVKVTRKAKVVRVRKGGDGGWLAGMKFVKE